MTADPDTNDAYDTDKQEQRERIAEQAILAELTRRAIRKPYDEPAARAADDKVDARCRDLARMLALPNSYIIARLAADVTDVEDGAKRVHEAAANMAQFAQHH